MASPSDFTAHAEAFLQKRQQLERSGKPSGAKIAYHYTSQSNITSGIGTEGLRLKNARVGVFGKGIYVGNNADAFSKFGDTGMMVLILTGVQKPVSIGCDTNSLHGFDSVVGNKREDKFDEETVLLSDDLVLPLLHYKKERKDDISDSVWRMHRAMQKWVDEQLPPPEGPLKLERVDHPYSMAKLPKMTLPSPPRAPSVCLVGLEFFNPSQKGNNNGSVFGQLPTGAIGLSPAGIMTVSKSSMQSCDGFNTSKALILTYNIPNGVQDHRHPRPGQQFQGGTCQTFLPDNKLGQELMGRLKLAFARGQVFTIDSAGTLRWNITPQKTAISGGGEAGYPDQGFLDRTKRCLDALNIPRIADKKKARK
jgi:hypothetical protein